MADFAVGFVLVLSMAGLSSATYCICKDGVSESQLQTNIDYACGAGADCTPILQNGPCFNPNTIKDHCNYAVNSYFQRKGEAGGTCDFKGTAAISQNPPTGQSSTCVYPSSASGSGGGGGNTGGGNSTPTITGPNSPTAMNPGGSTNPVFGLGPSGNGGIVNPDSSSAVATYRSTINLFRSFLSTTLVLSGIICLRA